MLLYDTKLIFVDYEDNLYKVKIKRYHTFGYIADNNISSPFIKKTLIKNIPKIQEQINNLNFTCRSFYYDDNSSFFYFEDHKKNRINDLNYFNAKNCEFYRLNMRIY